MSDKSHPPAPVFVKSGPVSIRIYPWTNSVGQQCWRFAWRDENNRRRYTTRRLLDDAKREAKRRALAISRGQRRLADLDPKRAGIVRAFLQMDPTWDDIEALRARKARKRITYGEACKAFAHTIQPPLSRYQRDLLSLLDRLGDPSATVGDLDSSTLSAWASSLKVGPRRQKAAQDALKRLWQWLAAENYVDATNGTTAASRMPPVKIKHTERVRYLSPDEMRVCLLEVSEQHLPWLVLAAFSGLRSEEIHARNYGDKPHLDWSQIRTDLGHIELLPSQSKTKTRRLVPILPTLSAWLDEINPPLTGRIVPGPPTAWQTKALGSALDSAFSRSEGWPKNCLRHSYGTYRLATTDNQALVCREMDNSPAMIRRHYDGVTTKDEAASFWALTPTGLRNS